MPYTDKNKQLEAMRDVNRNARARDKSVTYPNLFMADKEVREGLAQIKALDTGSEFEKQTVGLYVETALRKAYSLQTGTINTDKLTSMYSAELKKANPNASDLEIQSMTKARVDAIETLTANTVDRIMAIQKAFLEALEVATLDKFMTTFNTKFSGKAIDAMIDKKLSMKPEEFQKALFAKVLGGGKEDMPSFLERMRKLKDGEVK